MTTKVVCLKRKKTGEIVQGCDVYIGRRLTMAGWNLKDSKYHNPFKLKEYIEKYGKELGTDKCLEDYETYIRNKPDLLETMIEDLDGKVLGCWCVKKGNEKCHGHVLIKLMEEMKAKK